MARQVRLWVADDAVITVTGTEYGERESIAVPVENVNRQELLEQAKAAIAAIQGHIDDVQAALAGWGSLDAAGVKQALGAEVLPAILFALRVEKRLARLVANELSAVD